MFIEIRKPRGRNIIVGVIYRPPDRNLDLFLQQFNELMSKISRENKICYIMGDFNLNLMNHHLDSTYSNMSHPLISRPTRITSNMATLIDNIFTNNIHNYTTSGYYLMMFLTIYQFLSLMLTNGLV